MHNGLQWLGALVCWAGFAGLALGQNRHFSRFYQSFMPVADVNRAQEAIAIIAIFLAFPLFVKTQGAGFGCLLRVFLITASAITVALQLTWPPSHFKPKAWLVKRFFHNDSLNQKAM